MPHTRPNSLCPLHSSADCAFTLPAQLCPRPGPGIAGVAVCLPCTHVSYYSARTTGKKAPSYKPLDLPLTVGPLKCTSAHLSAVMSVSLRPHHLISKLLTLLCISQSTIHHRTAGFSSNSLLITNSCPKL